MDDDKKLSMSARGFQMQPMAESSRMDNNNQYDGKFEMIIKNENSQNSSMSKNSVSYKKMASIAVNMRDKKSANINFDFVENKS